MEILCSRRARISLIDARASGQPADQNKSSLSDRRLILLPGDEPVETADAFICHARADARAHPLSD